MNRRNDPMVSIITPTYNHERYIGQCIESVLAQSYERWEQIIIDDGSNDRTADVVSRFRDPRIRYVRQDHIGVFRLRETYNSAVKLAKGDLISVIEGDDLWPSGRMAALVPAFEDAGVVLAYGVCVGFNDSGGPTPSVMPSDRLKKVYGQRVLCNDPVGVLSCAQLRDPVFIALQASVIRRTALEELGGFHQHPSMPVVDLPTLLELGLKGRFGFVDQPTAYWRKHDGNVSTAYRSAILDGVRQCSLDFIDRHDMERRFPAVRKKALERKWAAVRAREAFFHGRRLLAVGQWRDARSCFQDALHSRAWDVRAAVGLAASYLKFDLELLMRLAGRTALPRF